MRADFYNACIQNPYNTGADKSRVALDVPLVFTFTTADKLPFGKGKAFRTSGPSSYILGGWQVNSIIAARSRTVINPTTGQNGDQANVGGGTQRGNFIGDPNNKAPQTMNTWFDLTAFRLPAFGTYRNAGLNSLRGPGCWDVNFSLFKNIHLHDRLTSSCGLRPSICSITPTCSTRTAASPAPQAQAAVL